MLFEDETRTSEMQILSAISLTAVSIFVQILHRRSAHFPNGISHANGTPKRVNRVFVDAFMRFMKVLMQINIGNQDYGQEFTEIHYPQVILEASPFSNFYRFKYTY